MTAVDLAFTDHLAGTSPDADGPPLVLLHAFPLHAGMFDAMIADLGPERPRVVCPDLRGFGRSPGAPAGDAPSIDAMGDDVVGLLDRLGIDRAVVGGVSLGGYVVMALLRNHPDRVAAALLIDTKASADDDPARANRERIATSVVAVGTRVLHPMLDTLLGPAARADDTLVAAVTGWIDAARPESVAWAQLAMATRPESFGTLAGAGVPVAVVVGEDDVLTTHDDALAMAAACQPPAPVHVIPGAGHLSPVERPDAMAGALREAWRRLS